MGLYGVINSRWFMSRGQSLVLLFFFLGNVHHWWCRVVFIDVPCGLSPSSHSLHLKTTFQICLDRSALVPDFSRLSCLPILFFRWVVLLCNYLDIRELSHVVCSFGLLLVFLSVLNSSKTFCSVIHSIPWSSQYVVFFPYVLSRPAGNFEDSVPTFLLGINGGE